MAPDGNKKMVTLDYFVTLASDGSSSPKELAMRIMDAINTKGVYDLNVELMEGDAPVGGGQ